MRGQLCVSQGQGSLEASGAVGSSLHGLQEGAGCWQEASVEVSCSKRDSGFPPQLESNQKRPPCPLGPSLISHTVLSYSVSLGTQISSVLWGNPRLS